MTQWITFFDKYFLWILLILFLLTEYIYSVNRNRMSRKEYIEEYKIESNSIYNNILLK